MRVENALCRSIRVTAYGADDVRTVFWRTTLPNYYELRDQRVGRDVEQYEGALDDNMLPSVQEKFAKTYKAAGGDVQYQLFEGCEHEWVATPGPQTDRAHDMVKAFIAKHAG